jgi:hypothetical protein
MNQIGIRGYKGPFGGSFYEIAIDIERPSGDDGGLPV